MTLPEYTLAAVFAAIWLIPGFLALRWERRLRAARKSARTGPR